MITLRNIRVVQLENGCYAVRRGWLNHEYLDVKTRRPLWWPRHSAWFSDCLTLDFDVARKKWEQACLGERVVL